MPPEPDISPLSHNIVEVMATEALGNLSAAALVRHPGERGRARENCIHDFIRGLVPPGFAVGTGFVIDGLGGDSLQQDLVIFRRDYHPVFVIGGIRYFPVEAVAATIEVKSRLDTEKLRKALANCVSVKSLDRTAGGRNYIVVGSAGGPMSHETLDQERHDHQVFSAIVAADASSSDALAATFASELSRVPRRQWPNLVVVADQWTLGYETGGRPRSDQMAATALRLASKLHDTNVEPLIDLAEQLWSFLRVTPLIDVQPAVYVRGSWCSDKLFQLPDA